MTNNSPNSDTPPATSRRPVKLVEHPTFRRWRSQPVMRDQSPAAVGLASLGGGWLVAGCNPTSPTLFAS